VHFYPTDLDCDWENVTKENWIELRKHLDRRDKFIADSIISKFNTIRQAGSRKRAIVIMNSRHAFPHVKDIETNRMNENVGGFLMAAYPGKVANVMINSVRLLPGSTDRDTFFTAIQEGKWDAAFAVRGNPDLGFDFHDSPFGEDGFDYFPYIRTELRYQDAFTGFVFFKPLQAHRLSMGLPGLFDQSFIDENVRRYRALGGTPTHDDVEAIKKILGTLDVSGYNDKRRGSHPSDYTKKINQWLRKE
jgi:hypothetical protein